MSGFKTSSNLARQVAVVPALYESGDKSTACLLKEAGLPDTHSLLSVDEVETELRDDPKLADLWIKRGQDQRLNGGWGIERDNDLFQLRSFSEGSYVQVGDRIKVCAQFVVKYVGHIAEVIQRSR